MAVIKEAFKILKVEGKKEKGLEVNESSICKSSISNKYCPKSRHTLKNKKFFQTLVLNYNGS